MTSWYVARGRTAACARLITSFLACSTDAARLLWPTREVHGGRNVHGARQQHFRAKPATVISAIEDVDGSEEKYLCSMTQLEEENWAARISSSGKWRWTRKRIGIRAAWEEKLQEKFREARRRLVAALPVGASAKKKTETLREMQANLKAEEEEFRKLLNKELASLELDLRFLSRRIEW